MTKPLPRTRCPWPDCDHVFALDRELLGRGTRCPRCEEVMTARPLEAWEAMERRLAALEQGDAHRLARLEGPASGIQRKAVAHRLYQRDPAPPHEHRSDAQYEAGVDRDLPRVDPAPELMVVLDDLRSQWNTGSILRSAEAAGFGRVAMAGITPLPAARGVQRVALGAEDSVSWLYEPRIVRLLRRLIGEGYEPVALEQTRDAVPIEDFAPPSKLALLIGSEVGGVSQEALRLCPRRVQIPLAGRKASLNAAVAFGVAAFRLAPRWREQHGRARNEVTPLS